jgi:hypothetical protein
MLTRRCSAPACLTTVLLIAAAVLAGCKTSETGVTQPGPLPSPLRLPADQSTVQTTVQPIERPTVQLTPTIFAFGPLIDAGLDLRAGPVDVPLELQIPALKVKAPVLGVGLNSKNIMDSPKGPIGDPIWHAAYWYRGGGLPGSIGTATIAGHVNDPLGNPEIFAKLDGLKPGDVIIIRLRQTSAEIHFIVNEIRVYSVEESSDPDVLTRIFGAGPVAGTDPQPAPDGLSHLTLITCAGHIVNGEFDHHTVVYATRSQ